MGEILEAAAAGEATRVEHILSERPNALIDRDEEGFTALHRAALNGHEDVLRQLRAQASASGILKDYINRKTTSGGTALHYAASGGHVACVLRLVEMGADVEATTNTRWTPLHISASRGHPECASVLIRAGASVSATTLKRKRPLDLASNELVKDVLRKAQRRSLPGLHMPQSLKAGEKHNAESEADSSQDAADAESALLAARERERELTRRLMAAERKLQSNARKINWEIPFSDVRLEKEIGHGNFGSVSKGTWRGAPVAVKQLQNITPKAIQELKIMSTLRPHCNVVQFLGYCRTSVTIYLVCEYLPQGSLESHLASLHAKGERLSLRTMLKFSMEVAAGMHHLHCEGVLHRDLAARNLLLKTDCYGNHAVALSDFGLSRQADTYMSGTGFGPIKWMPPEFLSPPHEFTQASDVWSFGVVVWEMMTQKEPFEGVDGQIAGMNILQGRTLPIPASCPSELEALLVSCWERTPAERPTFQRCYEVLYDMHAAL